MPSTESNSEDDTGDFFDGTLYNIALVCEAAHTDYNTALNMPCDLFQAHLKNAVVTKMMQSEQGRKQLQDYSRFNKTQPDIKKLDRIFGIEKIGGEK